jgi:hypothetical protein
MTDWNAIAQARHLQIPPADLAKVTPSLDALEEAFRPLLRLLAEPDDHDH